MQEVAKYVRFKEKADSLIIRFSYEKIAKDSLLTLQDFKLYEYKNVIIPSLKTKLSYLDTINRNRNTLFAIKEENLKSDIKRLRKGGWQKLSVGVLIGLLLGLFASN